MYGDFENCKVYYHNFKYLYLYIYIYIYNEVFFYLIFCFYTYSDTIAFGHTII